MLTDEALDVLFRDAVAAIDRGDLISLERQLREHPGLVRDRLEAPGAWLRDKIGKVEGFFEKPYLLWFVAEDPVRNGRLPDNIAQIARAVVDAARRQNVESLAEQLDHALRLVSWSWIAAQCDVQIALIDVLVDAGASPHGKPDDALVNQHFAAAAHLVERGATLTLATALCLERWDDVDRLVQAASAKERQFAFILAALNGKAEALRRMLHHGIELNSPSSGLYSHAIAVHHAVCSGSLDAVKVLVEAGADLKKKDTVWNATPLGWAQYYEGEHARDERGKAYAEIAAYLRDRM
jgi:hypothetical protein